MTWLPPQWRYDSTSMARNHRLLICFATPLEGIGLPASVGNTDVALLQTGIGPVNAAFALTRYLVGNRVDAVINCGVGGAYPGSDLETGSVACALTETY